MLGGGSQGQAMDGTQQQLLNETLANQTRRMNMQNPLYEAVQKLAMRLMPTAVQGTVPSWKNSSAVGSYNGPVSQQSLPPEGTGVPTTPNPGETQSPAPGREDPRRIPPERDPRVTSGVNGIDPRTLAQLFGQR